MGLCLFWDFFFSFSQSHALQIYCYPWHANVLLGIAMHSCSILFLMCALFVDRAWKSRGIFWEYQKAAGGKVPERKRTSPSHLGFVSFT